MSARLVENVDDMRLDVDEAEFEDREEPDRPRANNDGIRFDDFTHNSGISLW